VLCLDHPAVQRLIPDVRRRVLTYGFARNADVRGSHLRHEGLQATFRVQAHDEVLGDVTLGMPGQHNVVNALGAIAVALELQIPFETVRDALHGFTGVQRRFTVRGERDGVLVVDDYGHHPAEIEATLRAAELGAPDRRILAVFQPHRYSRVSALWTEFCGAFNRADIVVVCPVYAAGEAPIPGVDHERIAGELRERGHRGTVAVDSLDDATAWLRANTRAGDVVITLGAGDVARVCGELLEGA
jgi:UDP-N-acetylmuramate--alanine ligase